MIMKWQSEPAVALAGFYSRVIRVQENNKAEWTLAPSARTTLEKEKLQSAESSRKG